MSADYLATSYTNLEWKVIPKVVRTWWPTFTIHLDLTHVKTEEMSFNLSIYPEDMDHKYTDLNRDTLWKEDKTLDCSTQKITERRLRLGQEISFSAYGTKKDCKTADLLEHSVGIQHKMLVRGCHR